MLTLDSSSVMASSSLAPVEIGQIEHSPEKRSMKRYCENLMSRRHKKRRDTEFV